MPRVTVVTPAFNAASFIGAAIQSVHEQSVQDWEMVVVDDGSTDGTADIVATHAAQSGGRIRLFRQPNGGVSSARNLGMREARSPFIAFLDADDWFLPERLSATIEALEGSPEAAFVHGHYMVSLPDGRVVATRPGPRSLLSGRIARHIYTRRAALNCSTITFRRSCLDEIGYFDESLRSTEDKDLWIRFADRWGVRFIERPLAVTRLRPDSLSMDADRNMLTQITFVERHYGRPGCGRLARRRAYEKIHRERAKAYLRAGQARLAQREYLRGFLAYPLELENPYMIVRSFFL